jgi:hypothetical protein
MAQHRVQPTPLSHHSHIKVLSSSSLGGAEPRHLLQLPLTLTLSARHLHSLCCHLVLIMKHSAFLYALNNTGPQKVLSGQVLKLCVLHYWYETILSVANGIIPVCMELMHVLWHRPVH